ncbi:hypothetical protein Mal15_04800 [Stieleria maiorica]|uniref:Uncharacterized protein n=2 Tax=Stieleria maiorica TaxID=2795974 RepID=A0A5B9M5X0_9BACT|nr:hypothetical protein Mal15_04800 [Stieleria maiorica]
MLVCAILFPLVMEIRNFRRDEAIRLQLRLEAEALRQRLALDDPERQWVRQHQREEYASMGTVRKRAERQFERIQQKYGGIEVRGADVLSLRTVPQLSLGQSQPPVVYRLLVPTDREVWLKYAVVPAEGISRSPDKLDQLQTPVEASGFADPGPYQLRLAPGEQLLAVQTGPSNGRELPIAIRIDDKPLLDSSFRSEGVPSSGAHHISGLRQFDVLKSRRLPWLQSIQIKVTMEDETRQDAAHHGSLWLSDQPSGFDPFPGIVNQP